MPRSEMEAMLGKEKEKASVSLIYLDLKPSYDAEIAAKPYLMRYALRFKV